jgi:AhpD family alkylhydroperoxidase
MSMRLDYSKLAPDLFRKYFEFSNAVKAADVEEPLRNLVQIRASQLNGCAACLDMHVKEAKIAGERELRLYHVAIWRESPLFTPRERAAFELTEALTQLPVDGISDELYERVRSQFSDKELVALVFAIIVINGWNRANVAFRAVPGSMDKMLGLDKAGLQ